MIRFASLVFCFLLWACDALAQSADTVIGVTVGASSAQALAAGRRWYLLLKNESATASIACNFGGTAALNTAGNFTLGPGVIREWQDWGTYTFFMNTLSQQVNCIASAGSTPLTIEYH